MIDTLQIYQDLADTLGDAAARKLAAALGSIYRDLQQTVTKDDFRELKQVVAELAEAQKRTEQAMLTGFHDLDRRFGVLQLGVIVATNWDALPGTGA